MLSIGKVQRGASGKLYYTRLAEEDYYLKGQGEPPGEWFGRGARDLGLTGTVKAEDFCQVFDGYSPSGEPLSNNVDYRNRRPAFDLTFSAPKSVSEIRAGCDAEMAAKIDEAMRLSVIAGLRYMEREATSTRTGAQGAEEVEGKGLTVSMFQHMISRGLDPQLHVHCVVFNFTETPDGRHLTLDGEKLYQHKMAAGAVQRAELSYQLEQLGFHIERDRFSFRIAEVPKALEDEHSKRSQQVRAAVGDDEEASAARKAKETLETREPKQDVDRVKLGEEWRADCQRFGLTPESIREMTRGERIERDVSFELRETMSDALKQFNERGQSTMTERKLMEYANVEAQGRGVSANDVRLSVWATLEYARRGISPELRYLGKDTDGDDRFTTHKLYNLEQDIIESAERGRHSRDHQVGDRALNAALEARPTITAEQKEAVRHITQDEGNIKLVCGWAGTGKTYMLDTARDAWERSGYTVIGCAVAGKAARGLGQETHIKSDSIAKLLWDQDNPGRYAKFKPLDAKTIILVDEAGMVGTSQFHRLVTEAEHAGAKLVFTGDDKQLQSIDCGGGFSGLSNRLGNRELKDIIRQRDPDDKQAVYDIAQGRALKALKGYAERGQLVLGEDKEDAYRSLVSDFSKDSTPIEEKLILSSTNAQASDINRRVQEARKEAGELGEHSFRIGQDEIHAGDRILFKQAAKKYSIVNGDYATVTDYHPEEDTVTVKLDGGNRVTVPLETLDKCKLGYCVTSHSAQGATVEKIFVFSYGFMTDAQMAYVQTSRAKGQTKIYTTRDEAGPDLLDLARAMSFDRRKGFAHDQNLGQHQRQAENTNRHELGHSL